MTSPYEETKPWKDLGEANVEESFLYLVDDPPCPVAHSQCRKETSSGTCSGSVMSSSLIEEHRRMKTRESMPGTPANCAWPIICMRLSNVLELKSMVELPNPIGLEERGSLQQTRIESQTFDGTQKAIFLQLHFHLQSKLHLKKDSSRLISRSNIHLVQQQSWCIDQLQRCVHLAIATQQLALQSSKVANGLKFSKKKKSQGIQGQGMTFQLTSGTSMSNLDPTSHALWLPSCVMWRLCSHRRIQATQTLGFFQSMMFANFEGKLVLRMLQHIKGTSRSCSSRWLLSDRGPMASKIRLWVKPSRFISNSREWFETSKGKMILSHGQRVGKQRLRSYSHLQSNHPQRLRAFQWKQLQHLDHNKPLHPAWAALQGMHFFQAKWALTRGQKPSKASSETPTSEWARSASPRHTAKQHHKTSNFPLFECSDTRTSKEECHVECALHEESSRRSCVTTCNHVAQASERV